MNNSMTKTRSSKLMKIWTYLTKKETIIDGICGLFALLFIYAATSKLMEYDKFELQMGKSPIITDFAPVLVWMVPLVEIAISIMLFINRTRLLGLYAAFGLMVLFTSYIYAILNFSDSIPCSCGGVLQKLGWTEHLIFNLVFVVLGIVGILLYDGMKQKQDPHTFR